MSKVQKPVQGLGLATENDDDCFPGLVCGTSAPSDVRSGGLNKYAIGTGFAAALVASAMLAPQLSSVMAGLPGGNLSGASLGRLSPALRNSSPSPSHITR